MPFERKTLHGPRGFTIRGELEHKGEDCFHWIGDGIGIGGRQTMFLRIEKTCGIDPKYDTLSPIMQICFTRHYIMISLGNLSDVKDHILSEYSHGVINPYLNRGQQGMPRILIPLSMLTGCNYEVSSETNFHGDFIKISSYGKENKSRQLIMINVWAIGMLHGIGEISLNGKFTIGRNLIGELPADGHGVTLPFFGIVNRARKPWEVVDSFMCRSYSEAMRLINTNKDNYWAGVDVFLLISMNMESDRSSTPYLARRRNGVKKAKKAFSKLFFSR